MRIRPIRWPCWTCAPNRWCSRFPRIKDRYYVFQFVDLFGTNPHFIGSRATGSKAGTYLLVGPGWDGEARDEFDGVLPFDTDLVFVIGRTQLLGPDDVTALAKMMASYKMQPLSAHHGEDAPAAPAVQWPIWNDEASSDERFVGYLNFLFSFCQPIHPSEAELMACFAQIGIGPGLPFDTDALHDELREALRAGIPRPKKPWLPKYAILDKKSTVGAHRTCLAPASGMPATICCAPPRPWPVGAATILIEAIYPTAREDADGKPLDGTHRCQMTFTTPPPANAFWSITMYKLPVPLFIANPINRYSIGDRTPGFRPDPDGSVTIYLQHQSPGADKESNWLPAPDGLFALALRIYWPEQDVLDGSWEPSAIQKA